MYNNECEYKYNQYKHYLNKTICENESSTD